MACIAVGSDLSGLTSSALTKKSALQRFLSNLPSGIFNAVGLGRLSRAHDVLKVAVLEVKRTTVVGGVASGEAVAYQAVVTRAVRRFTVVVRAMAPRKEAKP